MQNDYTLPSICTRELANIEYKNFFMCYREGRTYLFSSVKTTNRCEAVKSKGSGEMSRAIKSNRCIPIRMFVVKATYSNGAAKIRNA